MTLKEEIQKELQEPIHYNGHPSRETEIRVRKLERLVLRIADECSLFRVSKRSELLAFLDWHYEDDVANKKQKETIIDQYLSQ